MCGKTTYFFYLILILSLIPVCNADAELIGRWKLDEVSGNVAIDSSGNGLDGICEGSVAWAAGMIDGAWQGNGSNAYIRVPHDQLLMINDAITISVWMNHTAAPADMIISKSDGSGTGWQSNYAIRLDDQGPRRVNWRGRNTVNQSLTSNSLLPQNEWVHITCTFDITAAQNRIYINGILDSQNTSTLPLSPGEGDLFIGADQYPANSARWWFQGMLDDVRIYDEALPENLISVVMRGGDLNAGTAVNPNPANESTDVPRGAMLSWKPGEFADTHNVYLGTSFDDVNDADIDNRLGVLVSSGQDANNYEPGLLEFDQTYYWRVDEVNAPPDLTVFKGDIWSFSTEPFAYPVPGDSIIASASSQAASDQGPANTVNGSGLVDDMHSIEVTDMWLSESGEPGSAWIQYDFDKVYKLHEMYIWNYNAPSFLVGFGLKEVVIEYSADGTTWTQLGDTIELETATGTDDYVTNDIISLGGLAVQSLRINANNNQAGGGFFNQYGLSEVRFLYIPVQANEPQPADGQTDVGLNPLLNWRLGREAVSHNIYFSSDMDSVLDGSALVETVNQNNYAVESLDLGTAYYWKVDEVNDMETPALWEGDLWSFITQEFIVIDDFEGYTDDDTAGEAIWQNWIDGFGDPANGSTAGYPDPDFLGGEHYVETSIVNSGEQSMPLFYDNTGTAMNSEVVYTLPSTWNLTASGADTLMLHYRGNPVRFAEVSSDHIIMSGAGADIYGTNDQFRFVYKQLTGGGSILARVESLDATHAWAKGGVMIRETLEPSSSWAMVLYANENGVRYQARLTNNGGATSDTPVATADQIAQRAPVWIRIERQGNQFNGYYSLDGQTWSAMVWNSQTINMPNTVYIGLAVTSHVSDVLCGAEFTSIETTGNLTGQWQVTEVGVDQPLGNTLDTLYVAVEDSAGQKIAINAEPSAVATGDWRAWSIPISDFATSGVDMTKVRKLYIGIGDLNNPMRGAGTVYIDDIQYGHPFIE